MENGTDTVAPVVEITTLLPAPGAEEKKPNAEPASDADAEKTDEVTETPEQQAEKRESRRARSNARKAAELAEARTEARMLRERLDKLEAQAKPAPVSDEPKEADFKDYTEYTRALARWEGKQSAEAILKSEREARETKEKQQQSSRGSEKVAQEWVEREKAFQAATKDYDKVVDAFTGEGGEMESLSPEARRAIVKAGPELLYYLGKHPEEAEKLADLSPEEQVMELGALRAKAPVLGKKTTTAPEPAKTLASGKTAGNGLDDAAQAEYEAKRKSQGARWAR